METSIQSMDDVMVNPSEKSVMVNSSVGVSGSE